MKIKMLIILLIMGLCYYDIALILSFERIYPEEMQIFFYGEIVTEKEEKDYYNRYIVKVMENKTLKNSKNTKLILYVKKDKELIPGDIILVCGSFEKGEVSRNYKGFNYRNYLKHNKIYGIVYADEINKESQIKDYNYFLFKIRDVFERKIDNLYEDDYSAFLKSLLIGNKSELSEDIIQDFKSANISHILAISGLHVSFVLVGINFMLEKIIISKKIRNTLLLFFLILFLNLTGNSVSCMRACIMHIFIILCSLFYKKNNFYISLILSLLFIIIINPYNIFSVGMWLSYAGTIGIVLTYDFLYRVIFKKKRCFKSFVLSLSAQIFIIPIMIYVFNCFSLTFFISNIITSIFISPILSIGYISIFISFIFFPLSKFISYFEKGMIYIILKTTNIVSQIPLSKIFVVTPSFYLIIIYYSMLFGFIVYFRNQKFHMLKIFLNKRYNCLLLFFNKKALKKVVIISIVLCLIIQVYKIDFNLKIYFVDVGQGDCTLIITPYGKRILIDGGEGNSNKYDYGEKVVFPYLLDRGIKRIDYMIASHADSDHIGGLIYVLENIKVENILIGIQPKNSNQLEKLMEIANNKNIKIETLEKGNLKKLDRSVELEVIWPDKNNLILENTLNNNSLVFKLKYNNFSILFTGDIEEIAENELASSELKATIVKIAHHGSKTSSTEEFLNCVNPRIALIGVGKKNNFGHPSEKVVERIEKRNVKIYRTDQMGEISIIVNRKGKISIKKHIK